MYLGKPSFFPAPGTAPQGSNTQKGGWLESIPAEKKMKTATALVKPEPQDSDLNEDVFSLIEDVVTRTNLVDPHELLPYVCDELMDRYVTCQDSIGAWTIFEARDSSTYTPGEETPVSNYQWNRVFYGSAVARVQLTAVNITYADGSTSSFTTEGDLNAILP